MEKLSQKIVCLIEQNIKIDNPQREIIAFGIQSALEIGVNLIASLLILWKLHMLKEGLFFFIIFIPLRKYSGGYHANTYINCFLISVIMLIIVMKVSLIICFSEMQLFLLIASLSVIMWKIGPVCVAERPVSEREYKLFRDKLKKTICFIIVLTICLGIIGKKQLLNILFLSMSCVLSTLVIGKIKYD